jgi:hypothetical protein
MIISFTLIDRWLTLSFLTVRPNVHNNVVRPMAIRDDIDKDLANRVAGSVLTLVDKTHSPHSHCSQSRKRLV